MVRMRLALSFVLVVAAVGCSSSSSGTPKPVSDAGKDASEPGRDAADVACTPLGSVSFVMHAPSSACASTSFSTPGDGAWWYSVQTAAGASLQIFQQSGAICSTCVPSDDAIGQDCQFVTSSGISASWNGTDVTSTSMCSSADTNHQPVGCDVFDCAPEGDYVVTMCANGVTDGGMSPTCVKVPFHFPTSSPVVGMVM
jgi:hypothetical protein